MNKSFRALLMTASAAIFFACQPAGDTYKTETGELGWPEITRENKAWTRWWWPASAVDKTDIETMTRQYAEAGLGGMEVTTIYGAKGYEDKFLDYLTPEWMELFTYTLKEAEKHDLGIDLANASGWPFGGPWVEPEDACRYLASKTFTLKGGESIKEKIEYVETPLVRTISLKAKIEDLEYPLAANDSLQQYAFDQVRYPLSLPVLAVTANSSDGRYEDLTSRIGADGMLDWTAPEGDWTVCALFLGWHGKMVERAGPGGEGDVIDHFSEKAITNYLKRFDEAFEGYDVSGIRYYFNDSYEVDDAFGDSDWTEDFFNEFKRRRGYDLKPYIPELLGISSDKEKSDRVVYDYRQTIGELLIDTYSVKWQEWAVAQGKGIRNQAHGSPANILDIYAVSDVPETEGRSIIGMKTASSAAHVTDKHLTSAEACTWLNDHFRSTLGDVKTAVDVYLLSGVNHIVYHGTCMSPDDAPWPGWMFYASVHFQPTNSFWADFGAFNKYVARCQSFLQAGKPDNDILLFFNATDLQSKRGREKMLFHMNHNTPAQSSIGESASDLYDQGYTWDYITDQMIVERLSVKDGKILTKGGASYQTLVLPECEKIQLSTFEKLIAMAKKGATIIIQNELPEDVPGMAELEKRRARLEELKSSLQFIQDGNVKVAKCGKGYFYVSSDLNDMLVKAGVSRETMYELGLQCISRVKEDGGKYYFVKNPGKETIEAWVPVDAVCGSIGIYNPMTDDFGFGKVRDGGDGRKEVLMKILPDESYLLETFAGTYSGEEYRFYNENGEPIELKGDWNVRFTMGGPELPAGKTVSRLGSWTEYGKAYEIFSGSAEYRTSIAPASSEEAESWKLDLGEVKESAAVYFNGEYVGSLFKKPFSVTLSKEQVAKGGELVVRVSNSMENRISYMDKNEMPWRILYNANIAGRTAESRGPDGMFSALKWGVADSGLIGPVSLTPLRAIE